MLLSHVMENGGSSYLKKKKRKKTTSTTFSSWVKLLQNSITMGTRVSGFLSSFHIFPPLCPSDLLTISLFWPSHSLFCLPHISLPPSFLFPSFFPSSRLLAPAFALQRFNFRALTLPCPSARHYLATSAYAPLHCSRYSPPLLLPPFLSLAGTCRLMPTGGKKEKNKGSPVNTRVYATMPM